MIAEEVPLDNKKQAILESTMVIGLGNIERHDDGIGIYCSEKLKRVFPDLAVYSENVDQIDEVILDAKDDPSIRYVFFIDACDFQGEPSEVKIVETADCIADEISTHKFPIQIYMELLRKSGKHVRFIGIQIQKADFKRGLTEPLGDFLDFKIVTLFDDLLSLL